MRFLYNVLIIICIVLSGIFVYRYTQIDIDVFKEKLVKECDMDLPDKEYVKCADKNGLIVHAKTKSDIPGYYKSILGLILLLIAFSGLLFILLFLFAELFEVSYDWNPITNHKERKKRKSINNFYIKNQR